MRTHSLGRNERAEGEMGEDFAEEFRRGVSHRAVVERQKAVRETQTVDATRPAYVRT
jgi:hypothetical protein